MHLAIKPQWTWVITYIYGLLLLLLLSGCASQHKAPVIDKVKPHVVLQGIHTVKPGETLYSIAEHTGHDYHELAALNGLMPPYRVLPGEKIRLSAAQVAVKAIKHEPVSHYVLPVKKPVNYGLVQNDAGWVWPAKGTVIRGFNPGGTPKNNGIDIAGTEGDTIVAAAPGKVVYSGNGLRAYGKLVIIKHNNNHLSAYGQNRKLLVKEGDMVKVGQKIAEMGRSSTGYAMLHFEIRKAGKPVDPKRYLAAG